MDNLLVQYGYSIRNITFRRQCQVYISNLMLDKFGMNIENNPYEKQREDCIIFLPKRDPTARGIFMGRN